MDKLFEIAAEAAVKLARAVGRAAEAARSLASSIVRALDASGWLEKAAALNEAPPRVRHLALRSKKRRIQKKNINRALREYRRRRKNG